MCVIKNEANPKTKNWWSKINATSPKSAKKRAVIIINFLPACGFAENKTNKINVGINKGLKT